jgi:hypothetical protein
MPSASGRKPFCSRYSYELLDATVVSLDEMELEKKFIQCRQEGDGVEIVVVVVCSLLVLRAAFHEAGTPNLFVE